MQILRLMLSTIHFSGLIDKIRDHISVLILLAEVLCLLDMLVNSFAHMISTKPVDQYNRPEFTRKSFILFFNHL